MNRSTREWHLADRRFRIPLIFDVCGYDRTDKIVETEVDFSKLLNRLGQTGTFNENSLQMIETDELGRMIDANVPFQLDRTDGQRTPDNADMRLIFLARGRTPSGTVRRYLVYYDLIGAQIKPAIVHPLITLTDPVVDEEQECFKISTPSATYFYQKQGAGFSSLLDREGKDWIGYRPGGGSAGEFRGIPNTGVFHPGYHLSTSRIQTHGPLKTTIVSSTLDGLNRCMWEIYPAYAVLTMLESKDPYWFLYEGTPGGKLDLDRDTVLRSTGEQIVAAERWSQTAVGPSWVGFTDEESRRTIYFVRHDAERIMDSYWPMNRQMTVYGIGRDGKTVKKYLTAVPAKFTFGLVDECQFSAVSSKVNDAFREYGIDIGNHEMKE
jgi:hypothetical protein